MPMPSAPVEEEPLQTPGIANIGRSVTIKGDVHGDEDLYIEGKVDGRVELAQHHLIIGPNGEIRGEVKARQVTVVGTVEGNITVTERVEVCDSGVVEGDITTPRLLIQEGASFNGSITMVTKAPEAKRPAPKLKLDRYEEEQPPAADDGEEVADTEDQLSAVDIESLMDTPAGPPPRNRPDKG